MVFIIRVTSSNYHSIALFTVSFSHLHYNVRLHSLCMLQGGAEDFFFSGSFFYIPPPRSIQIFRTPQAISRKINTPPSPLPPPKKYQNKYLYNSKLYMFEISRDMFNKNIERALNVYVIPMPASLSSAN